MSWKTSGKLVSGPPTLSGNPTGTRDQRVGSSSGSSSRLMDRLRPDTSGLNAFQRETQISSRYKDAYKGKAKDEEKRTEWDVLKENHRFIRDDEDSAAVSWEERLARAYESKLFKEFALIDLKHYKSKRFALRWRTAPEVVEAIGEDTCGSLRCRHHHPKQPDESWTDDEWDEDGRRLKRKRKEKPPPSLRAFELPFAYEEAGQRKEALVKVKLCGRCERKLKWKPPPDSESESERKHMKRRKRQEEDTDEEGRHQDRRRTR